MWQALKAIPYGSTVHTAILRHASAARRVRAVARACASIESRGDPCHRVIGKDNKLTGLSLGHRTQRKLLEPNNARVAEVTVSRKTMNFAVDAGGYPS